MSKSWEKFAEVFEELRASSTLLFVESTVHEVLGSFFGKIYAVSVDPPLIGVERFASRDAVSGSKWVVDVAEGKFFVDDVDRRPWSILALLRAGRISFTKAKEE
jgi:hypothetical protein